MANYKDITGQTFGRLTAIKVYGKDRNRQALWECECSCGTKNVIVTGINLRDGHTKSCGCLRSEKCAERFKEYHKKRASMKEAK